MKKSYYILAIILLVTGFAIWLSPPKVVISNTLTNQSLTITDQNLIQSLLSPLAEKKEAADRIKTPFSNTLIVYKMFLPIKKINFAMPYFFTNDNKGQVIIWSKVYDIDPIFYTILAKIEQEKNFSLETL